jgi:hypothetical protein
MAGGCLPSEEKVHSSGRHYRHLKTATFRNFPKLSSILYKMPSPSTNFINYFLFTANSRQPTAESRKPKAESRKPKAESRKLTASSDRFNSLQLLMPNPSLAIPPKAMLLWTEKPMSHSIKICLALANWMSRLSEANRISRSLPSQSMELQFLTIPEFRFNSLPNDYL